MADLLIELRGFTNQTIAFATKRDDDATGTPNPAGYSGAALVTQASGVGYWLTVPEDDALLGEYCFGLADIHGNGGGRFLKIVAGKTTYSLTEDASGGGGGSIPDDLADQLDRIEERTKKIRI